MVSKVLANLAFHSNLLTTDPKIKQNEIHINKNIT